ncbi:MAG: GGDEF domain-containing protein [Chromatiales bacterium]|jgi:diguanylate cyclase (GGDEF)-like protein|nr:GGDEF domain-containing protein [Chromatiales bacterium]MDX9768373.1 GGDEF domain-containing protein [Ectothiorhodospiraceae bacterium]
MSPTHPQQAEPTIAPVVNLPLPSMREDRPRRPLPKVDELALARRLQTSLDPQQLVMAFAEAVAPAVPYDGVQYTHEALGIQLRQGRESRHACTWNLIVEGEAIGELRFRRGRKYTEAELEWLENLMAILAYPLRNAILYQQAVRHAQHDPLTGLYNRAAMERMLAREIAIAQRQQRPLALMVVDVDHFKNINDSHGHYVGDLVLKGIADCIRATLRETDLAFRFGGEEFVIILPSTDIGSAFNVAERLRERVEGTRCTVGETTVQVTASIGITDFRDGDTAMSLFKRADHAMYDAKRDGRNRVVTISRD